MAFRVALIWSIDGVLPPIWLTLLAGCEEEEGGGGGTLPLPGAVVARAPDPLDAPLLLLVGMS